MASEGGKPVRSWIASTARGAWRHWVQFWWIDIPLAAVVVLVLAFIPWVGDRLDLLGQLRLDDRRSSYTDMLTITTLFAGFSTLATATYLGWSSRGVKAVQAVVGEDLLRVWLSATSLPWLCAMVLLVTKLTDRGGIDSSNVSRWVAAATLLVLAQQLVRVVWLFYSLAMIEQAPAKPVRPLSPVAIGMKQKGA